MSGVYAVHTKQAIDWRIADVYGKLVLLLATHCCAAVGYTLRVQSSESVALLNSV